MKTSAKGFFTNTLLLRVGKSCKKQHQKSIDIEKPQQSKNCLAWHNLVRPCCFCWQPWLPQRYFEVTLTLGNKGLSGNTENDRQMQLEAIFRLTKKVEYTDGAKRSHPQITPPESSNICKKAKFIVTATVEQAVQEWCAPYGIHKNGRHHLKIFQCTYTTKAMLYSPIKYRQMSILDF